MRALILWLTALLNSLVGGPLTNLLNAMGIHPAHPGFPITEVLTLELITAFLLIVFFIVVRAGLNVEKPSSVQSIAEMLHEFVGSQGEAIIGHGYKPHVPFVTMLFVFILLSNCWGLLPGIETPTAHPFVPLGLALLTFFYYNYHGLRAQGPVGYVKHFLGPVWWISPLLFPVEVISHLARNMSLTVRLYANMLASDLLTLVFFSILPLILPIVFLGLHFGVALIQSYVWMLLAFIYLAEAIAHHDDHEEAEAH
jgi:F-type H+-transporting ATPase subunit a